MIGISFISTGTTATQTPVIASVAYEIVKNWIKDGQKKLPDFPVACIFDFSNMYSTLQFFASVKILMRMGELTSLTEEMSSSSTPDWSKCSFPSKFVHKDTNNPLFFMIPLFARGMTTSLTRSEIIDLTKVIWDISQIIDVEGCQYLFFDLPTIESLQKEHNYSIIPALLNSNFFLGVVDCNKPKYEDLAHEVRILLEFLPEFDVVAKPSLKLNGLIFNQISETVLTEQWLERVTEEFSLPIFGKISEDPQFRKVISQYQIPTIDSLFLQMKCAKDFQATAEAIIQVLNEGETLRKVTQSQQQFLEDNIFKI
jgi:hypothetical protein